ncbi:hypothetical protein Tco_0918943 [Tanacetum coccineum]
MVAYLEQTDRNIEFHQIMDFLKCSSNYYALTVSPIVSTSFVEQFWMTAKSKTFNNNSYIDATVAGKPVTISEASIRSDLLFDDANGIDSLNNQAIFDNIKLLGPSPSIAIPDSNPEGSGGNHGGQSSNDISLSGNEDGQEAKERSQTTYHTSQILDEECCTEDKIGKEDFSKEKGGTKGHVGGKKHSDLKTKSFDEIQVLYEKIKRSDNSFIAIGSAEDEKMIKEMNE